MHSIVLTVHNKDWLVDKVLTSIYDNTEGPYEVIVVLDGCTDNSEKVVKSLAKSNTTIKYADDVFETKANNIGLKAAEGNKVIIIQDDMVIKEKGWNLRMEKPFSFKDVFAVTARTAHDWRINPRSLHLELEEELDDCWCDILNHTNHADRSSIDRDTFAVRSTVNRGPLMIDHEILIKLDYFDEAYSPQEMDDHDLAYRAFRYYGKVAGCYWIDYQSDYSWGGTRATGGVANWLYKANHKNMRMLYNEHFDLILRENHNENRNLTS